MFWENWLRTKMIIVIKHKSDQKSVYGRNEQELSKHLSVELEEVFSDILNVGRVSRSLMQICMNEQEIQNKDKEAICWFFVRYVTPNTLFQNYLLSAVWQLE